MGNIEAKTNCPMCVTSHIFLVSFSIPYFLLLSAKHASIKGTFAYILSKEHPSETFL